jgi:hypothetical protein
MKRFVVPLAILFAVGFVLFIARETRETVALASAIHPVFGHAILTTLLLIYAVCVTVPLVAFLRLPRALVPPHPGDPIKLDAHVARVAKRLQTNKNLAAQNVSANRESVEHALVALESLARQRILQAATTVFVGTAVSQSGRLDGLVVLTAQTRLVWQIAHLYWQRPTLRDLSSLYVNVATAALVAQNIDDFDFGDLVQPILAPVLANSAASAIPGFALVAKVISDATVEGTVNAFLTLRVGCVASRYCRSLTMLDTRQLRQGATAEAAQMIGSVARTGAERVAAGIWDAANQSKAGEAAASLTRLASRAADQVASTVMTISEKSGANVAAASLTRIVTQAASSASAAIGQSVGHTPENHRPD